MGFTGHYDLFYWYSSSEQRDSARERGRKAICDELPRGNRLIVVSGENCFTIDWCRLVGDYCHIVFTNM